MERVDRIQDVEENVAEHLSASPSVRLKLFRRTIILHEKNTSVDFGLRLQHHSVDLLRDFFDRGLGSGFLFPTIFIPALYPKHRPVFPLPPPSSPSASRSSRPNLCRSRRRRSHAPRGKRLRR